MKNLNIEWQNPESIKGTGKRLRLAVANSYVTFNVESTLMLGTPKYIAIGFSDRYLLVRPCNETDTGAIKVVEITNRQKNPFIRIKQPKIIRLIVKRFNLKLLPCTQEIFSGKYDLEKKYLIFKLSEKDAL